MTRPERDKRVAQLLQDPNRQPSDDMELEKLQAMQKFSEPKKAVTKKKSKKGGK